MDEALKVFIDDLVTVCRKHNLSFHTNSYDSLVVSDFCESYVKDILNIQDERQEILVQRAAKAERRRLIYERVNAVEIEAARQREREAAEQEENHARAFIARARERQNLIKI